MSLGLIPSVEQLTNWGIVAVGLGLVVFFHELGHFAVAKWCDVKCEKFYLGFDIFGFKFWSRKWGETEYGIGVLPLGGYVKMLGQDDMDPSQLSNDEIAEDPRSFTAKSVPQRMAIISAGVIMNVITGLLFFLVAFRSGVEVTPAVVGSVQIGLPAWEAGMQTGDRITVINDRPIDDFSDLMRATALSTGPLRIEGIRPDQSTFEVTLKPDEKGTRRRMGVGPAQGLEVFDLPPDKGLPAVTPGSAATRAEPPVDPGDVITHVDGQPVGDFAELSSLLADHRAEPVRLTVQRSGEDKQPPKSVTLTVPPAPFRTLGMTMEFGKVSAVRRDSPAARAGLQPEDRLAKVDGHDIGTDLDPLKLPDYFGDRHGQEIHVFVERSLPGGEKEEKDVVIVPDERPGWIEAPTFDDTPVSVPSIGIAYHMVPTVLSVEEGGPAAMAGIQPREAITKLELLRSEADPPDGGGDESIVISVGEKNWAHAFWQMQQLPARHVRLTVQAAGSEVKRTVEIAPRDADDWFLPTTRGIQLYGLASLRRADTISGAFAMGWDHTRSSMTDIYLTLHSLLTGGLSPKELHGPLGILNVASKVAETGIIPFLVFLGFLSINLAVLNFLPIPVLDGGHMVFLIWEGVTRRKPSERIVTAAHVAGFMFVVGLMLMVLVLDFNRLMSGEM